MKTLEISCVPTSISISLFIILLIFSNESFLFIVSLEKISIFLLGKFFFTSSEILSTPGPLKIKSQAPSFAQSLLREDLKPQ